MKKVFIMAALLLLLTSLFAEDMLYKVLDNGLEVIVKKNTSKNTAAVYGFVKTGSKSEEQYLGAGISHYLEHLVSSGTTEIRKEADYTKIYEELGLSANAYTTADMTAYHLTGEAVHTDTMITIIGEFLQHCVFAQEEVDREREVILKEMVMRSTDVYNVIHEWENAQQFPMTNYKYPVIGYPELYKKLTRDDLVSYYQRHYIPNNTIFVVIGNFNPDKVLKKVEAVFSGWERGFYPPVYNPAQGNYGGEFSYYKEFPINNARVSMNYIIPEELYALSAELSAAMDILFSKRTAAINHRLVEKEKLVNYIYGYAPSVLNMRADNSAMIGFEPRNVEDIDKIIAIIDEELEKAAAKGISQKELDNFLNREKAARILRELPPDREANSIAWSYYMYNQPDMMKMELNALEAINLEEIPDAISKILVPKLRVITKALPATEDIAEEAAETAQESYDLLMDKYQIDKDITLLYRPEKHKDVVYFNAHFPIHEDWETKDNPGIMQMITDLLMKGSKKYDALEISDWLEDHVIDFNSYVNYEGLNISIKCLTSDLEETLAIFSDGFNKPAFPQEEIDLWKNRKHSNLQRSIASAGYHHRTFRSGVLYPDTRNGMSEEEVTAKQLSYTKENLQNTWNEYFKVDGNVIIAINGDITKEKAEEISHDFVNKLRSGKVKAVRNILEIPSGNRSYSNQYNFEQVNVNINMPAPATTDPDFKVMTVIDILMNRMEGGLHEATRGVNDLAYFASANYLSTKNWGYFRITSQTSVKKRDELIKVLKEEIEKLKTTDIKQSDINLALQNRKKMLNNYISAPYIGRYSMQYEISGQGYDWVERQADVLADVTAEDIQRVAKKYFDNYIVIVSYPADDFKRTIE